jgi:hypothetical protein
MTPLRLTIEQRLLIELVDRREARNNRGELASLCDGCRDLPLFRLTGGRTCIASGECRGGNRKRGDHNASDCGSSKLPNQNKCSLGMDFTEASSRSSICSGQSAWLRWGMSTSFPPPSGPPCRRLYRQSWRPQTQAGPAPSDQGPRRLTPRTFAAHPRNEIYVDGFQGEELLKPTAALLSPQFVGYNDETKEPKELHTASMLHCEAEGDFWVRMKELAVALGLLATVVPAASVAGAVAGGSIGAAAGCAILTVVLPFLGGLACTLGAIIGGAIGAAAGAAIAGALPGVIGALVLQAIFDASPGEVEDANVGDMAGLGEIVAGSRVAVLGEHVYDDSTPLGTSFTRSWRS